MAAFVGQVSQTGIKRSENLHAWVRAGADVTQGRAVQLRLLLYVLVNFRCWKIASLGYVVASLLAPPVTSLSCHRGIVMTGGVLLPAWGISRQIRAPTGTDPFAGGGLWLFQPLEQIPNLACAGFGVATV